MIRGRGLGGKSTARPVNQQRKDQAAATPAEFTPSTAPAEGTPLATTTTSKVGRALSWLPARQRSGAAHVTTARRS
jgi:hypothetical protein